MLSMLELVPWHGYPHQIDNPNGALRQLLFGPDKEGLVIDLIPEDQLYVDVLEVMWIE
ncbi:MAG: hypothetical protein WBA97_37875 [Actinophytocola sp.]|uniref:hypothetical protein n=1 Tax=Actinophytocola sp. TaxID=1872138 RepID=UPI003C76E06A